MTITIRLASIDDLPAILELNIREYWKDRTIWLTSSQWDRYETGGWCADLELLQWYHQILSKCQGGIVIGIDNGVIIAQLDFVVTKDNLPHFSGQRGHIIWLLVENDQRRKGIAQSLIKFTKDRLKLPIWVEAEDTRTEKLYQKVGTINHYLSNWELQMDQFTVSQQLTTEIHPLSLKEYQNLIDNNYQLLVGRYYALCYDFSQLLQSGPAYPYIWGDTVAQKYVKISHNDVSIYAVITQYPRIFFPDTRNHDICNQLFAKAIELTFAEGFETLYFQVYYENQLNSFLQELGAQQEIGKDPVFQL